MSTLPPALRGAELANWLHDQLISPELRVAWNEQGLDGARTALAAEDDLRTLRAAVEGLAALAAYLTEKLKQPQLADAVLALIVEVGPRFTSALGQKHLAGTQAKIEKARGAGVKLGVPEKPAQAPEGTAKLEWSAFRAGRGPMKG